MQSINARIERSLIKIFLVLVGSVVLLSVAAYFGMRILRAWQERRLLAQAHALVNEGDLKRASFNAQRVLQLDPKSAAGLDVHKRVERPVLRNHVPVAANAANVASGKCEEETHDKKFRLHKIVFSSWTPIRSFLDSKILQRPRLWLRRVYGQINCVSKFTIDIKFDAVLADCPTVRGAGKSELPERIADTCNSGRFIDLEIDWGDAGVSRDPDRAGT